MKIFRRTIFYGFFVFLYFFFRKIRINPSCVLDGNLDSFLFEKGVKLGSGTIVRTIAKGCVKLGGNVWVSSNVFFETEGMILIEEGTTIQRGCSINGNVNIGEGCILAPNVFISSGTHPFREIPNKTIREQERIISTSDSGLMMLDKAVEIGPDCWLGVNSVICPGVTIGRGSIIGANTVVTKDVPDNTVVAGCPAKVIGRR